MSRSEKTFGIPHDQIRPLAINRGVCVASDRITVDGQSVGFMYREAPDNDADSGWRFLAGDESEDYMDDAENHGVHNVNTIANYDQGIVAFLDVPIGSAFERVGENGGFIEVAFDLPAD